MKSFLFILFFNLLSHTTLLAQASTPINAEIYLKKGLKFKEEANLKAAEENFEKAIALDSNLAEAYFLLGFVRIDLKDFQGAAVVLEQARKMKPDFAEVYTELGYIAKQKGENEKAIDYFKKALSLDNSLYYPAYYLGNLLYEIQDYATALAYFNKAVENNHRTLYNPYWMRAKTFKMLNQWDNALQDFQKVIETSMEMTYQAKSEMIWIYNELEQFEKAIETCDEILQESPNDTETYQERAYAKRKLKDYAGALADYEKVILIDGENAGNALKGKGICLIYLNRNAEACEIFLKAQKLGANNINSWMEKYCK